MTRTFYGLNQWAVRTERAQGPRKGMTCMSSDRLVSHPCVTRLACNPVLTSSQVPYPSDLVFNAGVIPWKDGYAMVFRNDYGYICRGSFTGTNIGLALLSFLGSLIPATRPYVQAMLQNSAFTIAVDVLGLLIAALFLISDFAMIDDCVKQHYPKEYEWSAAFGLVFTVIWIYLKILDLLMRLADNKNN